MFHKISLYLSGTIFASYLLFVHILSNISFLANIPLTGSVVYGSVALASIYALISFRHVFGKSLHQLAFIIPTLVLVLGIVYGVAINRDLYDTSFDGQAYQGEAVVTLIEGWNPIANIDSAAANDFVADGAHERWLNAYPKASWYNSVAIFYITGEYRDVKFFGFSLILGSFLVLLSAFTYFSFSQNKIIDNTTKLLLGLFLALNPIAITQATSLNLDGQVYSLLVMLFTTFFLLFKSHKDSPKLSNFYYLNTAIIMMTLINVKTAGLIYSIIFFGGYSLYTVFARHTEWKKLLITITSSLVLGAALLGFNPYLTNVSLYGNPLFPVFGDQSFSYVENTPSNYRDKSNVNIFFSSLFFKTDDTFLDGPGEKAELKLPFTIYDSEIDSLTSSQLKKGGFGPLFSGVLILALISLALGIVNKYTQITNHNTFIQSKIDPRYIHSIVAVLYFTAVLGITFFLTSSTNTFRYIPHLWFLTGVWITFSLYTKSAAAKTFAYLALITAFLNISLFAYVYFSTQIEHSQQFTKRLQELKTSGDSYDFDFGYHTPTRLLLHENQIPYYSSQTPVDCPPFRDDLIITVHGLTNLTLGCIITQ